MKGASREPKDWLGRRKNLIPSPPANPFPMGLYWWLKTHNFWLVRSFTQPTLFSLYATAYLWPSWFMLHHFEREVENRFLKIFGLASSLPSLGFLDVLHAQSIFLRVQGAYCQQIVLLSNKIVVFNGMYCYSPDFIHSDCSFCSVNICFKKARKQKYYMIYLKQSDGWHGTWVCKKKICFSWLR